jgi:hypothetical protein
MKHPRSRVAKGIAGAATHLLGVLALLAIAVPTSSASPRSVPGPHDDQPATTHCDTTITGVHGAVINVSAPHTYCLVNLRQTGAVNVAPGAALSVTGGSVINGAITLVAAKAFTFCNSSTKQGAINSTRGSGFVIIGNGGDGVRRATTCGANHIDGAVTLAGNRGGLEVGGNSIVGGLTLSSNMAPQNGTPNENNGTEIEANVVTGLTTCSNNIPAPVNDGRKNTFTGGAKGQCASL